MKRVLVLVLSVGLLALVTGCVEQSSMPSTQPTGPTTSCADPTHFVEAQAWWTAAGPGADDFGHAHLGACIPERDTISSPSTLPVRMMLHDNPGRLAYVSIVSKTVDQEITRFKAYPATRFTCPSGTCEQWFDLPLDPGWFDHSGLQEVRFRAFVDQPTGERMAVSLNWQLNVDNGASRADVTRMPYVRGKGWYTGFEYCESSFLSVPVPDGPVSGVWQPAVQQVNHEASMPVTWHHVAVDSNAHRGDPGMVLADGPGPLPAGSVAIDTSMLAPGVHRLVQRAECTAASPRTGALQTNSGVLVVPFEVAGVS